MAALTQWIANIILFILLATIIDMLLPNSSLQKYAKMVIGLLLMLIIITPVFQVLHINVDKLLASMNLSSLSEQKNIENLMESKKKEIQASQHAYILEQMAVQMETEVKEELMEQYGVAIEDIKIELESSNENSTYENITSIYVALEPKGEEAVSAIKVVSIDTSKPIQNEHENKNEHQITSFLANKWGIHESKIAVTLEEGVKKDEQG
ncbi:stage III sporulation protein AF [Priestia abyssalis]|uniref:stage III sporulation protein AF n=1 Tax=Priestia abyssalis TaxID=1221450 RepID=UPI0009955176|nr:stage III sporulation protein AF [Priestia abyssalis]